ncbi:hypothetical protein V5O48_002306 [Marasmius crinis-equi]|uniref:Uncharacterized protein n=1 Tax=Marasmius crinis-equi TaxID=585013 RepID=A0ABR3FWF8_9AGAR
MKLAISLCFLFCLLFVLVGSVPVWESATGQFTINSLVPFASFIEAKAAGREAITRYLTFQTPEPPGNLTVTTKPYSPPLFYVRNNQLFHYVNESFVFPVNVINTTTIYPPTAEIPLQLVMDSKSKGVTNGSWKWRGTMLHYHFGGRSNGGVYFLCETEDGGSKLVMFLRG